MRERKEETETETQMHPYGNLNVFFETAKYSHKHIKITRLNVYKCLPGFYRGTFVL